MDFRNGVTRCGHDSNRYWLSVGGRPAERISVPPRFGQLVEITAGDIDCVTAGDFAVQYDLNGDKYQQIGPFTCYSGTR